MTTPLTPNARQPPLLGCRDNQCKYPQFVSKIIRRRSDERSEWGGVLYCFHMRRFVVLTSTCLIIVGALLARPTAAATTSLATRLSGYILLQVQRNGETWYVYPNDKHRYYLGNPSDAFKLMTKLSLGISDANLAKIPMAGSTETGDLALRQRLSGMILLQTEQQGQTWYVNPRTLQRTALGSPTAAFKVMRTLSLGTSNTDLATIPVAPGFDAPKPKVPGLTALSQNISTSHGTFLVDSVTLDMTQSSLRVMTDTILTKDCSNNCPATSLLNFVSRRGAPAGIHGTYFCPPEYSSCAGQTGFYFYPVYNSFSQVMINEVRMKYTTQPIIAIDTTNRFFYYSPTTQFHSLAELKARLKTDSLAAGGSGLLQAAISNSPIMVINGQNVLNTKSLDTKQATVKSFRGFLAWKGRTVTFGVVHGATVTDSAAVTQAMGFDYALNLDGGGSTALIQTGSYILGPGRNIPNAILLVL